MIITKDTWAAIERCQAGANPSWSDALVYLGFLYFSKRRHGDNPHGIQQVHVDSAYDLALQLSNEEVSELELNEDGTAVIKPGTTVRFVGNERKGDE